MRIPNALYKYKSLSTTADIERLLEIIKGKKIYLPRYDQLNDPLEGAGYNIEINGWAGCSIAIAADEELSPIEDEKKRFRILSLSSDPVSPQLWSHYSNNYDGVCLCFSTKGVFSGAKPVIYKPCKKQMAMDGTALTKAVYEGFFHKQDGWSYEKEWRIVRLGEQQKEYLQFDSSDLKGVIFGHRVNKALAETIASQVEKHVSVLVAEPGYQTAMIHLLKWNYDYVYDGETKPYIINIEDELFAQ